MGSGSTQAEAVKGTGKFPIFWIADNRLKTVESLLLKGVAVFRVYKIDSCGVEGQERRGHVDIHDPPSEGNFRDEHGNAIKPAIVSNYNRHMGYVDKTDRMASAIRPAVEHGSGLRNSFSTC